MTFLFLVLIYSKVNYSRVNKSKGFSKSGALRPMRWRKVGASLSMLSSWIVLCLILGPAAMKMGLGDFSGI